MLSAELSARCGSWNLFLGLKTLGSVAVLPSGGKREMVLTYGSSEIKFRAEVYSIVGHHVAGKSIISLDELQELLD